MRYTLSKNKIEIFGKDDFNPSHILECGQIFSYVKKEKAWEVFSKDKKAEIVENDAGFVIETDDPVYFENFFDLKTDYGALKRELSKYDILKEPIKFGSGIRILKQDLFETLISFIVSANNNIKRIQLILGRMRERLGTDSGGFHAFPTREQLLSADENFFSEIGAGYRDKYLFKVLRQVDEGTLNDWRRLPTNELRGRLVSLAGVGPKVADCVLLFGFGRGDVFPVDTWIEKMYRKFYVNDEKKCTREAEKRDSGTGKGAVDGKRRCKGLEKSLNETTKDFSREQIRKNLTAEFGEWSGYAQQYLFYFMRSGV